MICSIDNTKESSKCLSPRHTGKLAREIFRTAISPVGVYVIERLFSLEDGQCSVLFSNIGLELNDETTIADVHKVMIFMYLQGAIHFKIGYNGKIEYRIPKNKVTEIKEMTSHQYFDGMIKLYGVPKKYALPYMYICRALADATTSERRRTVLNNILKWSSECVQRSDYECLEQYWNPRNFLSVRNRVKIHKSMFFGFLDINRLWAFFKYQEKTKVIKRAIMGSPSAWRKLKTLGMTEFMRIKLNSDIGIALGRALDLRVDPPRGDTTSYTGV